MQLPQLLVQALWNLVARVQAKVHDQAQVLKSALELDLLISLTEKREPSVTKWFCSMFRVADDGTKGSKGSKPSLGTEEPDGWCFPDFTECEMRGWPISMESAISTESAERGISKGCGGINEVGDLCFDATTSQSRVAERVRVAVHLSTVGGLAVNNVGLGRGARGVGVTKESRDDLVLEVVNSAADVISRKAVLATALFERTGTRTVIIFAGPYLPSLSKSQNVFLCNQNLLFKGLPTHSPVRLSADGSVARPSMPYLRVTMNAALPLEMEAVVDGAVSPPFAVFYVAKSDSIWKRLVPTFVSSGDLAAGAEYEQSRCEWDPVGRALRERIRRKFLPNGGRDLDEEAARQPRERVLLGLRLKRKALA